MKYFSALLSALLLLSAHAQEKETIWFDSPDKAKEKAGESKRPILLRQILCECKNARCEHLDRARSPWFMDDPTERKFIQNQFVLATEHGSVKPRECSKGFASEYRVTYRAPRKIATLVLDSEGEVIHDCDWCEMGTEIGRELRFALEVARLDKEKRKDLHTSHAIETMVWHPDALPGTGVEGCACEPPAIPNARDHAAWVGYNRAVKWHLDCKEACELAAKEKKLVLFFQVVGELHKAAC